MALFSTRDLFYDNVYIFLGIIVGVYLSIPSPALNCHENNNNDIIKNETLQEIMNTSINNFDKPKIPLKKQGSHTEKKPKPIRPRYYSTELGMKEKLFIGIFTSEEKINTQAVHINNTIAHLVDKIKFFMTAQYKLKTKFNLTGLVGFTDTRMKYRPFQIMKYVGDTFGQDYDYYFFAQDYTFIDARKLNLLIRKISVSNDVYLGVKHEGASYCNLDSGIILSNSVLKSVHMHLDWCILNAVSEDHSENIGRCVYHSLGLSCQDNIQDDRLTSFKLKHFELKTHLTELKDVKQFNDAVTVYPVLQKDDFYLLNVYYLKQKLELLNERIKNVSKNLNETWPPGQRPGATPATRFDLPKQNYFNLTHVFFPDDFTNVRQHTEAELIDLQNVLDEVKAYASLNVNANLQYRRLVNGYRKFDLSRGMDYVIDFGFRDTNSGKEIIKRFEVSKPLGNVEFISTPYVTENTRVTIILPIQENEIKKSLEIINNYVANIMDRKEKTFLMLALLYQSNSSNKGASDVYKDIKEMATKISNKFKYDDMKIAWVSIRLPEKSKFIYVEDVQSLNFAIVDLALKKIGLDSMVLILDANCNFTQDFLNRVRMNTIANFQIFNPIPFRLYNPKVSQYDGIEINKNSGHFDKNIYKYVSFYGRDYVYARKKIQHLLPLVRVDNDISRIIEDDYKNFGNIFEMFLKYHEKLNCMRATEMNLKVKYHESRDLFLGSESQLANYLLTKVLCKNSTC